jgi:transposase-like protein
MLARLQARRRHRPSASAQTEPPNAFLTEQACEEHLRDRFGRGLCACPRCGGRRGHYLPSRHTWECAACKRQAGLRVGTVAANSPLPLVTWFAAIRLLLHHPTMGTNELGAKLGIGRAATVRTVAGRIREAMAADDASQRLAGLDVFYARRAEPDSSAREEQLPAPPCAAPGASRTRRKPR